MNINKILQQTSYYREYLLSELRNKKRASAYLQVTLDKYQEDGDVAALKDRDM